MQLTRDADPVDMISRLDGLVMTGGADPDPSLYGEDPHPELGEIEPGRDEWELALIRAALDRRLPMLCVCRGAQLLNIALGGTLVQHLDESDTHALVDDARGPIAATPCGSAAGSRLESLYGDDIATNSLHHQAVGRPGDGVIVTGTAEDGVDRRLRARRSAGGARRAVAPGDARRATRPGLRLARRRGPPLRHRPPEP